MWCMCVCGGASVWVRCCGCVFWCVCVGACVVQVYICVRVLPGVFVLTRVCGCVWAMCVYVCVRGRVTERERERE